MTELTYFTRFKTLEELMIFLIGLCLATFIFGYLLCWLFKRVTWDIINMLCTIKHYFEARKKGGARVHSAVYEYRVELRDGRDGLIYCNDEFMLACNHYENALLIKAILEDDDISALPFDGKGGVKKWIF